MRQQSWRTMNGDVAAAEGADQHSNSEDGGAAETAQPIDEAPAASLAEATADEQEQPNLSLQWGDELATTRRTRLRAARAA